MTENIKKFVSENYPATAFYAVVKFDSEYNDETYNNRVKCLMVYDKNKDELLPKKACTEAIHDLLGEISVNETSEEKEEMVVIL